MVYLKIISRKVEENLSLEFILEKIYKTRNYFLEEPKQIELTSRKQQKVCGIPNYVEHVLVLASTVTGCISIPSFASLFVILIGIMSYAAGLKICGIAQGVKRYFSQ